MKLTLMVDRELRKQYVEILRNFAAEIITVDQYEDLSDDVNGTKDEGLGAIWSSVWCLYVDFRTERLRGEWALDRLSRPRMAGCILFLGSDEEFFWQTRFREGASGCLPGILFVLMNTVSFGFCIPLIRKYQIKLQCELRLNKFGDLKCWPFLNYSQFEVAKRRAMYFAGHASKKQKILLLVRILEIRSKKMIRTMCYRYPITICFTLALSLVPFLIFFRMSLFQPQRSTKPEAFLTSAGNGWFYRVEGKHVDLYKHRQNHFVSNMSTTPDFELNHAILASPSGRYLCQFSPLSEMYLWDTEMHRRIPMRRGGQIIANWSADSAIFSPDEHFLALERGGALDLLDLHSARIRRLTDDVNSNVHSPQELRAAFSSDGRLLAAMDNMRVVRIWNVRSGKSIRNIETFQSPPDDIVAIRSLNLLRFTPDSAGILTLWNKTDARIWNIKNGKSIQTIYGILTNAKTIAVSEDCAQIATSTSNGEVRIYNRFTRREVQSNSISTDLTWNDPNERDFPNRLVFAPNGKKLLAAAGQHLGLRVWDTDNGKLCGGLDSQHLAQPMYWVENGKEIVFFDGPSMTNFGID